MPEILFDLIKDKVYKDREIQDISLWSTDKQISWVFDFKSQGLSRIFLQEYARHFWEKFRKRFGDHVQVGGMETGAIALVASIALHAPEGCNVSGFYIRKSRKKSDLANLIEGNVLHNIPIILVDDILNFGTTIRKQVEVLKEFGYKVVAVFVCLRFRESSHYQDLADQGILILSIFELNDFSKALPVKNLVSRDIEQRIKKYIPVYKVALTKQPNLYRVESKASPVVVRELLYIGTDDGTLYCLRSDNGSVVWIYRVLFGNRGRRMCSTVAIFEDRVLFGAYDGNVYCLNRFSGKREWVFMDADWVGSSPYVDDEMGILYVCLGFGLFQKQGGIVALDVKTGEVLWKYYQMSGLAYAPPVYNKRQHIVVCGCEDGFVYGFDSKKKGYLLWKFRTNGSVRQGVAFHEKRNLVVFGSMDGSLYVLNAENKILHHRFEARAGFCATPVIVNDFVIIGSLDKNVYCFNIATKKTEWIYETSGRIFASPTIDKGSVFIGSNDGVLYELDIQNGSLLSQIQLTERIVDEVRVTHHTDGRREIYIPTHTCELYKMREQFF